MFVSRFLTVCLCVLGVGVFSSAAFSQEGGDAAASTFGTTQAVSGMNPEQLSPEVRILQSIEKEIHSKYKKQAYVRSQIPSLFFTSSQHALLREARVGFNTRIPGLRGESAGDADPNDPNYRPPVSLREVSLAGILYNSDEDWTVYLNKVRVTPDAIPSEVVDIKVFKDYIELRWFDQVSNQVFPIRLRPNQRFNLDARVFLPGQSS